MSKILNGEFRKELYKNLVDAGYEKLEAQKIIGSKYYAALSEDLQESLKALSETITNGDYENGLDYEVIAKDVVEKMPELKNLHKVLNS